MEFLEQLAEEWTDLPTLGKVGTVISVAGIIAWKWVWRALKAVSRYLWSFMRAPIALRKLEDERRLLGPTIPLHGVRVGRDVLGNRVFYCDVCFTSEGKLYQIGTCDMWGVGTLQAKCHNCAFERELKKDEIFDLVHDNRVGEALGDKQAIARSKQTRD